MLKTTKISGRAAGKEVNVEAMSELTDEKIDQLMRLGLPNTRPSEGFRKFARAVEQYALTVIRPARNKVEWPEGYCLDPDGAVVPPAGKHADFTFGYNLGYGDGLVAIKDSVKAIEARVRAALSRTATPAAEGVSEWRSMETVPKDRSVLLYAGQNIPIYVGRKRHGVIGEPQWNVCEWRCDSSGRFAHPTHWRELPAAPIRATPDTKESTP